jgi:VWFA-related protein
VACRNFDSFHLRYFEIIGMNMKIMQDTRDRWTLSTVRRLAFLVALFSAAAASPQQAPPPKSSLPVMRVTTSLVVVDVVVYDKEGNHVRDLTAGDFTLLDRGKPQKISVFSDEDVAQAEAAEAPLPPSLPPGVFTNRPEFHRPEGPPVVLLLDGLNTAMSDQISAHDLMLKYLRTQLREGQRTAILSLHESLALLQDFTTDPKFLIAALERDKVGTSNELSGSGIQELTPLEAETLLPEMLRRIDALNQSRAADSTDMRVRITLAALRSIARALDGLPGRKNLVWVSSVFPFNLQPGTGEYSDAERNYEDDIRHTAALLASARVAVYPVDARGLYGGGAADLGSHGLVQTVRNRRNPMTVEQQLANSPEAIVDSHETMQDLAKETGGMALYNENDVDRAVALSAADGERYYTLGYYPQAGNWDGKFHRIEVKIDRKDLKVRHRNGYFAVDVQRPVATGNEEQREHQAYEELRAALADPLPATQVTFRVHIPDVEPAAKEQVQVQFLVDAPGISFDGTEKGAPHCNLDFMAAAVTPDGKVAASDGRTVDARLKPEQYARVRQNGLPFSIELSVPPGSYSLRLAVRDNRTGLIGTLTVPFVAPAA